MRDEYIITRIRRSGGRVTVDVAPPEEEVVSFRMTEALWDKRGFESGDALSEEEYRKIENESTTSEAVTKAARYLALSSYSEKGLFQKLRRSGFGPEVSERAVAIMKKKGFIDEKGQAESYVKNVYKRTLRGPARIENDLVAHGYPRVLAKEAVSLITREEYEYALEVQIEKKCRGGSLFSEQKRRSVISSLVRLGFNASDVVKKLGELEAKSDEYPDE